MSAEDEPRIWWSRLVRDADGITGPAKAVCWFLADVADKNGASWYSQEQIALKAGVTDRTVRNALDKLVGMGVVRVDAPTRQRSTQTVTLIASGLAGRKEIPVGAERDSTPPGKRFHPERKDVPVGAERRSDKVPKKSPEDPTEVPNEEHTARDDEPPNESDHMPTDHHGSRPTMDAGPIDNDGATTHPPKAAAPSLPSNPTTDEVSDVPNPADDRASCHSLHADGVSDACPGDRLTPQRAAEDRRADQPVAPGQHVREPGAVSGRSEAPGVEAGDPRRAAGDASTLSPAPATSETSAAPDPDKLWSLQSGDGVAPPPAKPKRKVKEKTETDAQRRKRERAEQAAAEAETMLTAWGLACQSYDTISGKVRRWDPAKGDGRLIAETMAKEGQARIVARFAQAARDPWCLDRRPDLAALCRGSTPFVSRLDAAAEQAALDAESRSGEPQAVGGMLTHPSAQNAPERQPAPKQNGSAAWDDMLSVIRSTGGLRLSLGLRGSTLSHEPGEHKRRCQAVADIGGWAKLCEMGEHNRGIIRAQFVSAYDRAGVTA